MVGLLTGCVASQPQQPTTVQPATDRLLTPGDIQVAQEHLRAFGFDPGPVNGVFTAETQAAVRAYQAREGLPVTGLLDRATRRELLPGFDQRLIP
jgi:peptidoglycan hydrolase-like protein with peptidoglycan-binding domain